MLFGAQDAAVNLSRRLSQSLEAANRVHPLQQPLFPIVKVTDELALGELLLQLMELGLLVSSLDLYAL